MFRLFVGSNNKTKRLELDKAVKCVARYYKGFTYYTATGFWEGVKEKSVVFEISGTKKRDIDKLSKELCNILAQQAVGIQRIPEMSFISI